MPLNIKGRDRRQLSWLGITSNDWSGAERQEQSKANGKEAMFLDILAHLALTGTRDSGKEGDSY